MLRFNKHCSNSFLLLGFLPILFSLCLIFLPKNIYAEKSAKYKVGVIAPLTGVLQEIGKTISNSITLAQESLAKEGFSEVEFIIEDDQFLPKNAVAAALKLLLYDKVNALIVFGSGSCLAVLGQPLARNIPFFALAMSEEVLEKSPFAYVWFATVKEQTKLIIKELEDRKYSSFATVSSSAEALVAMNEEFKKSSHLKPTLVLNDITIDDDMRIAAMKIKRSGVDAVYMMLFGYQSSTLAKRLKEIKYKGDLFSAIWLQERGSIAASYGALDNAWFPGLSQRNATVYKQEYGKNFSHTPEPGGSVIYDLAKNIIKIVHNKSDKTKELLRAFNEAKEFKGDFPTFKTSDRTFSPLLSIMTIKGGVIYE